MNLNTAEWEEFVLGKLFDIKKGKRLTSEDQEDGINNYVGAIDSNNGIANHIAQKPIHEGNTISLSYNGSVGEAFYQKEPYWSTDDVNALYSYYEGFNEWIGFFVVTILRQEKHKFSYGRKWTLDNMNATIIKLPIQHNLDGTPFIDKTKKYSDDGFVPDWMWMEKYIKFLHHKPLTTINTLEKTPKHNVSEWKEFEVGHLFRIEPTKGKTSDELIAGDDIPYIAAKHNMNGWKMTCQKKNFENWISKGNCIVFIQLGAGSAGYANYIKEDFIGMNGKTSCGYIDEIMNQYIGQFLATILCMERPKYSFGRSWTGDRLSKTTIKLPILKNSDGTPVIDKTYKHSNVGYIPDWEFMENYIKSLPYGDKI